MSLDLGTILNLALGSLIPILGSITVAILYIHNQNEIEKKKRLHETIQRAYFEEGILPVENAVSEYGTSTVFAIYDLGIWVKRCLQSGENFKLFEEKIVQISRRPSIIDLTNRNFTLAVKHFPIIQRFGMPLYNSIKRTFQVYSTFLSDILTLENIQRQIEYSSIDEFIRSSINLAGLLQQTEIYLERRLEYLKEYIWQRDYEEYLDFLRINKEQKYQNFISELNQYLKYLDKFWKVFTSESKPEDRRETSLALSKWLNEHIDLNPFEQ